MQYLLPCGQCGVRHVIDSRQAGQQVVCACGAALEVPSLRGIRELQPAEATPAARPTRKWSADKGLVFGLGMFAVIAGLLVLSYGLLMWLRLDTSVPAPEDLSAVNAELERKTPAELLSLWDEEIRKKGLGPYRVPGYVIARDLAPTFLIVSVVGAVLAAGGLVAVVSTVVTRKPAASRRRK